MQSGKIVIPCFLHLEYQLATWILTRVKLYTIVNARICTALNREYVRIQEHWILSRDEIIFILLEDLYVGIPC